MDVPANSMGSSSAIAGQGAIDTFERLLKPTRILTRKELVARAKSAILAAKKNMNRKRQTNP